MKYALFLAGFSCLPCMLLAQPRTTGGMGQIITSADIYCDRDLTTLLRQPYILYKDSGYTCVFHYDDIGGCDQLDGRIITSFDNVITDTAYVTQFGEFDLQIMHTSLDTGSHSLSFSFDALQASGVFYHELYAYNVRILDSVAVLDTTTAQPSAAVLLPVSVCLYPNPAQDSLFIAPLDSDEATWQLTIFDDRGNAAGEFQGTGIRIAVSTDRLPSGHYYAVLKTRKRIIKNSFEIRR